MTGTEQDPVYVTDSLIAEDIDAYLDSHQHKTMLRFITCGSVDDGKSTLIGRLLYDSKMIFEDQLDALAADSKKQGTQGQEIDFALLVDGLAAERVDLGPQLRTRTFVAREQHEAPRERRRRRLVPGDEQRDDLVAHLFVAHARAVLVVGREEAREQIGPVEARGAPVRDHLGRGR